MYHIIYLSRATAPFDDIQLQQLLLEARSRNAALGITGILLYGQDQFLQLLEGEEGIVQELYSHIRRDPRHTNVTAFADKGIRQRAFPDWAMAYHPLEPARFQELAGIMPPAEVLLKRPGLAEADQQLLQLLRAYLLPAH